MDLNQPIRKSAGQILIENLIKAANELSQINKWLERSKNSEKELYEIKISIQNLAEKINGIVDTIKDLFDKNETKGEKILEVNKDIHSIVQKIIHDIESLKENISAKIEQISKDEGKQCQDCDRIKDAQKWNSRLWRAAIILTALLLTILGLNVLGIIKKLPGLF